MSSIRQLFAPKFKQAGEQMTPEIEAKMALAMKADTLRYLPIESIASAIGFKSSELCQACITGNYPTPAGTELYQIDLANQDQPADADTDRRAFDPMQLQQAPS
jgi:amidophosphoribosyltransferase